MINLLKIENNEAYFLSKNGEYKLITEISTEDIFYLLNILCDEENCILDTNNEENNIKNIAEKIIYEQLFSKFNRFLSDDKEKLLSELQKMETEI